MSNKTTHIIRSLYVLTLGLAQVCLINAQTFIYSKGEKKVSIGTYAKGVFYLKNGESVKGYVDSINEKEILIKTEKKTIQTVAPTDLAAFKRIWYLLYWGGYHHFWRRSKKYDLTDYTFKYVPRKSRKR